jgi:hypothetical protein
MTVYTDFQAALQSQLRDLEQRFIEQKQLLEVTRDYARRRLLKIGYTKILDDLEDVRKKLAAPCYTCGNEDQDGCPDCTQSTPRPYTLTPATNPETRLFAIAVRINGEVKAYAESYLAAEMLAKTLATPQCSTPACGFKATYQCYKCRGNLCPAHAVNVGRGFIYCGLCAPQAKTSRAKKATKEPTSVITTLQNSTRDELGIQAWIVTTREGNHRTHHGFVLGPDSTISEDLGKSEYYLDIKGRVDQRCTDLVHELALQAA